jgi:hypothetical protein
MINQLLFPWYVKVWIKSINHAVFVSCLDPRTLTNHSPFGNTTESRTRLSALTRHAAALGSASNTPHSSAVYEAAAAACGGRLPISLHDAAR